MSNTDWHCAELSLGNQRFLLMDEPFFGLGCHLPVSSCKLFTKDLHKEFGIDHYFCDPRYWTKALKLGDRIAVLQEGEIVSGSGF